MPRWPRPGLHGSRLRTGLTSRVARNAPPDRSNPAPTRSDRLLPTERREPGGRRLAQSTERRAAEPVQQDAGPRHRRKRQRQAPSSVTKLLIRKLPEEPQCDVTGGDRNRSEPRDFQSKGSHVGSQPVSKASWKRDSDKRSHTRKPLRSYGPTVVMRALQISPSAGCVLCPVRTWTVLSTSGASSSVLP